MPFALWRDLLAGRLAIAEDDPRQIRDRAVYYLGQFLRAAAGARGLAILLEDLHWADDDSLDALAHSAQACGECAVLIAGPARPALFERRPDWLRAEAQALCARLGIRL
jgi:predicted ATPase